MPLSPQKPQLDSETRLLSRIRELERRLEQLEKGKLFGTELGEITEPDAPAAGRVRIYATDSGGKTALMAKFATGAAQQIGLEP